MIPDLDLGAITNMHERTVRHFRYSQYLGLLTALSVFSWDRNGKVHGDVLHFHWSDSLMFILQTDKQEGFSAQESLSRGSERVTASSPSSYTTYLSEEDTASFRAFRFRVVHICLAKRRRWTPSQISRGLGMLRESERLQSSCELWITVCSLVKENKKDINVWGWMRWGLRLIVGNVPKGLS